MRLLIATDAWLPQVNGVVRTYERLTQELRALGVEPVFLSPSDFSTIPCPTYLEIRLAIPKPGTTNATIEALAPDAIHIATEGPIGWIVRAYCLRKGFPFTTSFHTRFPEYLSTRFGIPERWTYAVQRRFHNAGAGTMVATNSLSSDLRARGFTHLVPWTRGVDTELFRPRPVRRFGDGPVFLNVGRVALEKNLDAFLRLELPGRSVIVGDGPQLSALKRRYPSAIFTGELNGNDLAECYASADVFVFPSMTDTFGLVLLEAMACGLPIAAYPVTGPLDLVQPGISGVLSEDLGAAALAALSLDRNRVRACAHSFSWAAAARLFLANVEDAHAPAPPRGVTAAA
jgi:1,2-diacylglycerol 3-alpha-glucosyltransferase/glucuronosyltransferase